MRQVLPTIDFRSQAERQGITKDMQTVQAIVKILQTVGAAEQKRREEQTLGRITRAISGGATIIEAVNAAKEPEFGTGIPGALQRFGGMFQPSPGGMGKSIQQAIIGQKIQSDYGTISPSQMINTERLKKYHETDDPSWIQPGLHIRPPTEAQDLSGVELEEYLEKLRRKKIEKPPETPLTEPQVAGYGEAMDARLDKAKRHWTMQKGRVNYPESELFRQWEIFTGIYKFKNEDQKESIWNTWKNKVTNRGKAGWFGGKETDWDPTDPKWREAIGLKAPVEDYQQPRTAEDFEKTVSLIKNQKQQELYYNKWKHLWPDDYE